MKRRIFLWVLTYITTQIKCPDLGNQATGKKQPIKYRSHSFQNRCSTIRVTQTYTCEQVSSSTGQFRDSSRAQIHTTFTPVLSKPRAHISLWSGFQYLFWYRDAHLRLITFAIVRAHPGKIAQYCSPRRGYSQSDAPWVFPRSTLPRPIDRDQIWKQTRISFLAFVCCFFFFY